MSLISYTPLQDGVTGVNAAATNTPLSTIYNDYNGNITDANISSSAAIAYSKLSFPSTGGIWWEELGRTTLGVAGDTISIASFAVRKYLQIIVYVLPTGGSISCDLRFNNDSAANYAISQAINADTYSSTGSLTLIGLASATFAHTISSIVDVTNTSTQEKLALTRGIGSSTSGAANAPGHREGVAKWSNTSNSITRVDILNTAGTGDFAIGSEVVVLGHN